MKRVGLLLLLLLPLCESCNKDRTTPSPPHTHSGRYSEVTTLVTIDAAEKEVLSLVYSLDAKSKAGGEARRIVSRYASGGEGVVKANGEIETTPLVYVFNFEDNRGYAIAAGDSRVSPVLCLTDKGNLNPDTVIDNPGLILLLSDLEAYYRSAARSSSDIPTKRPVRPLDPPEEGGSLDYYVEGPWENVDEVGTILPCHWDQYYPFNAFCKDIYYRPAFVGCMAIAIGQIMYHWGKNTSYGGTYYDWTAMREVICTSSSPETQNAWYMVQSLLRDIGNQDNLDLLYGAVSDAYGTSNRTPLNNRSFDNVYRTFDNFGYASGGQFEAYNTSELLRNLSAGPAIGVGTDVITVRDVRTNILGIKVDEIVINKSGHVWVYDKAITQKQIINVYNYDNQWVRSFDRTRSLVHINWGWGGEGDGYFLSTDPASFDTRSTIDDLTYLDLPYDRGESGLFQYDLLMNCGIRAY